MHWGSVPSWAERLKVGISATNATTRTVDTQDVVVAL
jgi:hypothetical protein